MKFVSREYFLVFFACAVVSSMIVSSNAMAGSWVKNAKVVDVRWYPSSGFGFVTTDIASNSEGCTSNSGHRYFDGAQNGHEKVLSIALTALTTGKSVDVFLNGCGAGYTKLDGIIIKAN